ncbi:MAG: hypothetical protein KA368_21170 [Acidobacteria bacterium]|nr:hypothetical protein [Acidobacteriota bacterium]
MADTKNITAGISDFLQVGEKKAEGKLSKFQVLAARHPILQTSIHIGRDAKLRTFKQKLAFTLSPRLWSWGRKAKA